jgi:hypothetical protein
MTFQAGLFVALWVAALGDLGWRKFLPGYGLAPHVRNVRGWAGAGPVLVSLAIVAL